MPTKSAVVGSAVGLHARPASIISEAAPSEIAGDFPMFHLDGRPCICGAPGPPGGRLG